MMAQQTMGKSDSQARHRQLARASWMLTLVALLLTFGSKNFAQSFSGSEPRVIQIGFAVTWMALGSGGFVCAVLALRHPDRKERGQIRGPAITGLVLSSLVIAFLTLGVVLPFTR